MWLTAPPTRSQTQFLNHSLSMWFLRESQSRVPTRTPSASTIYLLLVRDLVPGLNGARDGHPSVADHVGQRGLEAVAVRLCDLADLGGDGGHERLYIEARATVLLALLGSIFCYRHTYRGVNAMVRKRSTLSAARPVRSITSLRRVSCLRAFSVLGYMGEVLRCKLTGYPSMLWLRDSRWLRIVLFIVVVSMKTTARRRARGCYN